MDLTRTRLRNWDATWASYAFGAVDRVTPDISLVTAPIKVGSVGDIELGERIIGLTGKIRIEVREIDVTLMQKLLPWYSSGAIAMTPATINKDLYDYAGLLTLHPQDAVGGATTEDLNFVKAIPTFKPMDRNGVKDDVIVVEFKFYPDRTQLPTRVYGYVGAVPA